MWLQTYGKFVSAALYRRIWARIRESFGGRCAYCGTTPAKLIREHMFPRSRGGDDSLENIVPACSACNTRKSNRTPLEWFLGRPAALTPADAVWVEIAFDRAAIPEAPSQEDISGDIARGKP